MNQAPLFPISDQELTQAAFELVTLLQELDEEDITWDDAKKAHRERMAVLRQGIGEQRQLIRRAQLEREEGLTQRQVDALLNEAHERGLEDS